MTSTRGRRACGLLACVLVAVAAALGARAAGLSRGLEERSVEVRFALRGAERPTDVVVVAIDDVTFAELGRRWPFPRSLHARVVDRLRSAGARRIVYDVQFTEPTRPREDWALYQAIARARHAVLATTEFERDGATNVLGGDERLAEAHASAAASNLPDGYGGILDRFPHHVGGLRSLAVVAAEMGGHRPAAAAFPDGGARIDFRGPPGTIRTVSFSDVLRGEVPASVFRGRVVVVGASAPSLQDVHPTPTATEPMAGPEIQANAIWTAIHGLPLRDAPPAPGVLLVVLLACAVPLSRRRLRVLPSALLSLPIAAADLAAAQLLFERGVVIGVAAPLLALAVGTVTMIIDSHLRESAARRRVARVNDELESRVRERTRELRATQLEILQRLAGAAEWRDNDTGEHINRIGTLTHRLALAVGLPADQAEMVMHASIAHDIGKVGVPDRILLKPGRLDDDERATMERHALIGASMLAGSDAALLQLAEEIARTHHERWNGTGYPDGLRGEEIPLPGRICAICDVFDALVSARPYKRAWTLEEALDEIRAQAGKHFDPQLVEPFVEIARAVHPELYDEAADVPVSA